MDVWTSLPSHSASRAGEPCRRAEEAYSKALTLDPANLSAYSGLFQIMAKDGRLPDLLHLTNKALSRRKIGRTFKAFVRFLRALAFLFQQDISPFRKNLISGIEMTADMNEEQRHEIVGELSDLFVDIMERDNLKTIRTFIHELEKISADLAALFGPLHHVLDYFEALFSEGKNKKQAADKARRVLDRITGEIRGPVEEMVRRVEENIKRV